MNSHYLYEDSKVLSCIAKKNATILDIGCGEGRYIIPLSKEGHHCVGVDINPILVHRLKEMGLDAYTPADLNCSNDSFDYVIMSHIIEHISPAQFIPFMDNYISKLKVGGKLIISTPMLYDEFYDDYDHIKPYTPKSITVLYSDYTQQQQKPRYRLENTDIWLRKWPYVLRQYPPKSYLKGKLYRIVNILLMGVYSISFHLISRTTGWVGVYERIQ